jgi:hypothetical protein
MFNEIEEYVDDITHNFVSSHEIVLRWDMVSRVDLIDDHDQMWTIKCSGEISLKHTLQTIFSTLMYNTKMINDDFTLDLHNTDDEKENIEKIINLDVNYINFMKGEEISYNYKLSLDMIKKIVKILQKNFSLDQQNPEIPFGQTIQKLQDMHGQAIDIPSTQQIIDMMIII